MKQINLAVATDFAGEGTQLEDIEQMLKRTSEAGFTHIHWCHEWDGDYLYSSWEMEQIREWMELYGLKAKGVHASKGSGRDVNMIKGHCRRDYTSQWEYNRKAGVELIKNRVDLASCIGAKEVVLHLYVPHLTIEKNPEVKEIFYTQVRKSLDELYPYCLEKGVKICLENLFDMPGEYILEQWDRLLAVYPEEFLGICLDTGHAFMSWGDSITDIIRKYGNRIYAVHLHDNKGTVDFHLLPGEGRICWKEVMAALRESAYELPLVLEINCYEDDTKSFLKEAYQAGSMLMKLGWD
jgi:sugar phosphate isomerase/epimerase